MKTIVFGGVEYTCPFIDVMPPLPAAERDELRASIRKAGGVTVPVAVTDANEILDGHNRLAVAAELGRTAVPMTVLTGLTAAEKMARAEDLNLHRRHLTRDQKREIIARRLKADPGRSNNVIAAEVKADDKTVRDVRRRLESTSEIPKLEATRGKDGRIRPATRRSAENRPQSGASATRYVAGQEQEVAGAPAIELAKWSELDDFAGQLHRWANDLARPKDEARRP